MCATRPGDHGQRRHSERLSSLFHSLFRRKSSDTTSGISQPLRHKPRAVSEPVVIPAEPCTHASSATPLPRDDSSLAVPSPPVGDETTTSSEWNVASTASATHLQTANALASDDLWSAAFREAVEELKTHTDVSLFEGQNIAQLFENLKQIDEEATQEDAFLRGVKLLRSIQIPLENFKLALDLATPLTALEPTTMTVFGVVRSVTASAISFASADQDVAKQIGEMLHHMEYIDDCDTLGRRMTQSDIHKTLVLVYGKILEFYKVAFNILNRRGVKLILKMVWEKEHLPEVVQDFLKHADFLGRLVTNATLELTADIKDILTLFEIYQWLGKHKMETTCPVARCIDIFSVLILQLLEQLPGLKLTFYEWYKKKTESGINPAKEETMLEEFLRTVIAPLDRPLYIVIDALDECDRATRRKLVKLLKSLAEANSRLKVLLSSRASEETLEQLHFMGKIEVVADDRRDRLISQHMVDTRLCHLSADVKEVVIESLARTAHGSAIWTKLMIDLIEVGGYTALHPMKRFLEKMVLPTQLSSLYDQLLSRCASGDFERRELAIVALRILSAVHRPLSISELASAVTLAAAPPEITTIVALGEMVDEQRILGLIRPFIARIDSGDNAKRQIRLVHQSVKEYVVERFHPHQTSSQYPAHEPANTRLCVGQVAQHTEECILNLCIRYLLLDEVDTNNLFTDQEHVADALPQDIDLFEDTIAGAEEYTQDCTWEEWETNMIRFNPSERGLGEFFVYASCHWTDHLGAVDAGHLPDLTSVEKLCSAGSTRLYNWIEQKRRPDCVLQARFPFDSTLYDPLSIVSLYGSEAVLLDMLKRSTFRRDSYQSHSARNAVDQVIQWAGPERFDLIVGGIAARVGGTHPVSAMVLNGAAMRKDELQKSREIFLADVHSLCARLDDTSAADGGSPV